MRWCWLFTDTETGKNPPQQVIGAESTGKLTQKVLGFAKFSVSSSPAPANVSCTAHARGKHWHGAVLQDDACGQLKLLSEVCSWPCRPLDGLAAVPGLALKLTWPSSLTSRASHWSIYPWDRDHPVSKAHLILHASSSSWVCSQVSMPKRYLQ